MEPLPVSVEADLYVLLGLQSEKLWQGLSVDFTDGPRAFVARHDEVKRDDQPVPGGMSDWRYQHISISPDDFATRAIPIEISSKALDLIPDTLGWMPLQIVSSRFRAFLEAEFPNGGAFYPFTYRDAVSQEVKSADFWFWLPKHYLLFRPKQKRTKDQHMRPQVWGVLGGLDTTWEMHHNRMFQEFVAELPYWTASPDFSQFVFRSDVYHRLRAEGFTGFNEAAEDNHLRHTPNQSVGYIRYVK